jgi:hypothetical protein
MGLLDSNCTTSLRSGRDRSRRTPNQLIVGDNRLRKTSRLRQFIVLGTGRSFRVRRSRPAVVDGTGEFRTPRPDLAVAQLIEVRLSEAAGCNYRRRASPCAEAELAARCRCRRCTLKCTPHRRCSRGRVAFSTWGAFHVKQSYLEQWRRYHRRSAAKRRLKDASPAPSAGGVDVEVGAPGCEHGSPSQGVIRRAGH